MTTSTSSATTPSPQMAFLHATPVSLVGTIGSADIDATEREARQQAIRKFLARAEISKVSLILLCLGAWYASSFCDDPRIMTSISWRWRDFCPCLCKVAWLPTAGFLFPYDAKTILAVIFRVSSSCYTTVMQDRLLFTSLFCTILNFF